MKHFMEILFRELLALRFAIWQSETIKEAYYSSYESAQKGRRHL